MKTIWKGIDWLARAVIGLIAKISPKLGKFCLSLWENEELVSYLFVGVATTLVNYVAYFIITRCFGLGMGTLADGTYGMVNTVPPTAVSWAIAVAFGYWANKVFVFKTHCPDMAALVKEAVSFVSMRLVSLLMEMALMFLTVNILGLNDLAMKLVINLLVIIANYVFSKLFIFKKA